MNYRHAFHAGNFADVFKHAVLVRILVHLGGKPAAYRVIDTHAGGALYDLTGPEATRGGEWRAGIGRLIGAKLAPGPHALLAPYLDAVAACNRPDRLTIYPGSPALSRALLRSQDRLIACEIEPNALASLRRSLGHDRRIKVIAIDGWTALNAYVPAPERRGLVLIDPPYEEAGDFASSALGLERAHRKWAGAIYVLWYPIKDRMEPDALARRLRRSGIGKILRAEVNIGAPDDSGGLAGCGLIVVNPPWRLEEELDEMLPGLASILAPSGAGRVRVDWLAPEASHATFPQV
jgi:23S rRNA (adenine2030-N6)-methyltransferase